jgi:glycerol-3-phosphate dehydrogenase (NAD(P)+)
MALAKGLSVEESIKSIGQVVEGYRNTAEVHLLTQEYKVEMPICDQMYQVLYKGVSAKEAAYNLLSRAQKQE